MATWDWNGLSDDLKLDELIRLLNVRMPRLSRALVPLTLTDGVTAPATVAGVAQLYVDTTDGDLKCRFGDGFTATIALDS